MIVQERMSLLLLRQGSAEKDIIKKIIDWKKQGYEIMIYYLKLPSAEFALELYRSAVEKMLLVVTTRDLAD